MTTPTKLANHLIALRDNAYLSYMSACGAAECLGEEIKIERCEFGAAELKAHRNAAEWLGKHRAFARAAELVALEIEP